MKYASNTGEGFYHCQICHCMVKGCYECISGKYKWASLRGCYAHWGFTEVAMGVSDQKLFIIEFKQRLRDCCTQNTQNLNTNQFDMQKLIYTYVYWS